MSERPVKPLTFQVLSRTLMVPGTAVPLVRPSGSSATPDTLPMPRTVRVQMPGLAGADVAIDGPSSGSEIADP